MSDRRVVHMALLDLLDHVFCCTGNVDGPWSTRRACAIRAEPRSIFGGDCEMDPELAPLPEWGLCERGSALRDAYMEARKKFSPDEQR